MTFRVIIITSQFRRSEPSSLFSSGIQSHHCVFSSAVRAIIDFQIDIQSRILSFDVQSRCHFSVWRSWSSSLLFSFGIQSHHRFLDRHSESHPQFRRSESSSLLSFGVQSHNRFSVLAFRAITIFSFGVQSHHRFSVLAFIAITIFGLGFQSHYCHLV